MSKTILFENLLHNGDIHMSRAYVLDLMEILGDNHYYYHHTNNPRILSDIKGLKTVSNPSMIGKSIDMSISTWIGQFAWNKQGLRTEQHFDGCNFVSYYSVMRRVYQSLGIIDRMKPIDFYYPKINYDAFSIQGIKEYFKNKNQKHILICNNHVSSGQAHGSVRPLIEHLSSAFPNYTFIVSNKMSDEEPVESTNVVYASDIINDSSISFDMNEISYLANSCDVIIGRSSGPYSFSITQNTIRSKIFICFCNSSNDSWWTENTKNLVWSNQYDKMNEICANIIGRIK